VEEPKARQDKRVTKRMNRCPDFFEPERTYYARISGQMIIVIPNKSGMERRPIDHDCEGENGSSSHPF
jgi:hypothetical protein